VIGVLSQHRLQLSTSEDEHPVQHLTPNGADPSLRVGIRPWRPTGVRSTSIPSAAKTASNAAVNLVSGSRTRNRNRPTRESSVDGGVRRPMACCSTVSFGVCSPVEMVETSVSISRSSWVGRVRPRSSHTAGPVAVPVLAERWGSVMAASHLAGR
jgi:hypothetical protein